MGLRDLFRKKQDLGLPPMDSGGNSGTSSPRDIPGNMPESEDPGLNHDQSGFNPGMHDPGLPGLNDIGTQDTPRPPGFEFDSKPSGPLPSPPSAENKDSQLILAKLDAIKSEIDSLHQRVQHIERMAEQSKDSRVRW